MEGVFDLISLISDSYLLLNLKTPIFSVPANYSNRNVAPLCERFEPEAMLGRLKVEMKLQ